MKQKTFTLKELALLTNTKLIGNPDHQITNVETLELATSQDASFLGNSRYEGAMRRSEAGVIFIDAKTTYPENRNFLIADDPSYAFQLTVEAFYEYSQELTGFEGIHSTAVIHPTAKIGNNITIGPHTVIDKKVTIGDGTTIAAGCYIGPFSEVGQNCLFHPRVTIRERCLIGNRVILQSGAVIGSCGFGYITNKEGQHIKLNQVGIVVIGDDVEIGANTTIDRSRFKKTEISRGTKIDNLVQIGHGVHIGQGCLVVAQAGIAGSSRLDKHVIIGGQVAIAGHLHICSGTILAGRSGVTKSLKTPGKYAGLPAINLKEHNLNAVYLRNIACYIDKIKELDKRLKKIEEMEAQA